MSNIAIPITLGQHTWQKELAEAINDPKVLLEMLGLSVDDFIDPISARTLFSMRVPKPFIAKMKAKDSNDPLLLQVLPQHHEFATPPDYMDDPLAEQQTAIPGLLHKYKSRVLVMFRTACAVNCRYCFRRHFPYQQNHVNRQKLQEILSYIDQNTDLNEVILSGGDPLMADDRHIQWFVEQLQRISHIKRFRIHSRLPVVIPSRITPGFVELLANSTLQTLLVLHINHANEIDQQLTDALKPLRQGGVTLLNQAVLLKDINDSVTAQVALSEALFAAGILPYYLHVLDKVTGAAHFDVTEQTAKAIVAQLLIELPGFLVPKLVREIPGEASKTPIS